METSLQPSPEQDAIIASRRTDPGGSLRVVAFAGSGKTTALHLSRSWRFGEDLACLALAILAHTSEPPALALRGDPGIATLLGPVRPPCTVLCRTNAGLFEAAIRGRDRIHLLGGLEPLAQLVLGGLEPLARLILGGWQLYQGQPVPDLPSLARFRSWDELLAEAEEARDPELRFLVQIIVQHGRALPRLVADLRRRATPHPAVAERVLSTAHKAKGLEWPRVRLAADFPRLEELQAVDREGRPCWTPEERDQELHLLYVAATRACQQLEPNAAVLSCLATRALDPGERGDQRLEHGSASFGRGGAYRTTPPD